MSAAAQSAAVFAPLPWGQFGAVLADPPWLFENWSEAGEAKNATQHYGCLPTPVIASLGRDLVFRTAPDCCLFLCAFGPMIPDALHVMDEWGFRFVTKVFTWAKRSRTGRRWHFGPGYWSRRGTEDVYLGTIGSPKRLSASVRELIEAPVRENSRKPDELQASIERLVAGPYLELFAREQRPGWTAWGRETGKFGVAA
jgi:N6-adenosine-specific RNA methylase IME4